MQVDARTWMQDDVKYTDYLYNTDIVGTVSYSVYNNGKLV